MLVGDDGRVRVADFGLAAQRDGMAVKPVPRDIDLLLAATHRSTRLSSTIAGAGALVGTPAYMAPEQLRREPATAASDQFAFCVALHEALYGRRPFTGDTIDALTHDVVSRDLPRAPPDAAAPAWLYAVVRRGLARDPADRFPDMHALLAELARDPDAERARRRQRRRQLAAAVVFTLLVVLGGVSLSRSLARVAHERRADARLAALRDQLAELRAAGRHDEAARAVAAFAELADNRGTAALARAHREWAAMQTDPAAALDALGLAYVHARDPADRLVALRDLAVRLADRGAHAGARAALATLDARDPAGAADPALAGARLAVALDGRDLPAARAALARLPESDPRRTYDPILEHLSLATEIACERLGRRPGAPVWLALDDWDGDGRPEVLTRAPTRGEDVMLVLRTDPGLSELAALRVPVPADDSRTHLADMMHLPRRLPASLGGEPLVYTAHRNPDGDGSTNVIHALAPLTPGAAPVLTWADSPSRSTAIADLDRDGRPELYIGHTAYSRGFWRISRDPDGGWRRRPAQAGVAATRSDIMDLAAGDLDGDGVPELVVAVGAWTAYDVRVLRADDRGELRLVARRTLGHVPTLTLPRAADGRRWIAAAKRDEYPNPGRLGQDTPFGEPAGVYILELVGDELAVRQFFPAENLETIRAGDLDADGRDDLVAEADEDLLLVRQGDAGFLAPLRIEDSRPVLIADLDDDPAAEIVVRRADDPAVYLALGAAGGAPVPPLPRAQLTARPVPEDITDPALADAWRLAEDLAAIGLPRRAADALAASAGFSEHAHEDMLLRAGQLYAAAGEHAAAADRLLAAAARPDLADAALAGAIASHRARREFAAAEALAGRRAALPDLEPAARAAAEAELAALRRVGADRPTLALRFDRPLDPAWRIADPLALAREPGVGALSLRTSPRRALAELPLAWDGGSVALTVDATIVHADWATNLEVSLMAEHSDDAWLTVSLGAGGQVERPVRHVAALTGANAARTLFHELPRDLGGRVRVHFRHDPELGLALVELTTADGVTVRRQFPDAHGRSTMPGAPAPGPLRLRLLGHGPNPDLYGHILVHAIDVLGVRLDAARAAPDPDAGLRRLLVEGELGEALALLADAPAGDADLWRAEVLARLGRLDEAAAALRVVVADAASHPRLVQLLLRDPDPLRIAASRALGPDFHDFLYSGVQPLLPWRPVVVRRLLDELATHPQDPPAAPDPDADLRHCEALMLRGCAWQLAGRLDLARRDLEASWRVLDDPTRPFERRDALRGLVLRHLIDIAAQQRDAAAVRRWLGVHLDVSAAPELSLETSMRRRELVDLLSRADWDALAARAHR